VPESNAAVVSRSRATDANEVEQLPETSSDPAVMDVWEELEAVQHGAIVCPAAVEVMPVSAEARSPPVAAVLSG
jgi:hypothetical protein